MYYDLSHTHKKYKFINLEFVVDLKLELGNYDLSSVFPDDPGEDTAATADFLG